MPPFLQSFDEFDNEFLDVNVRLLTDPQSLRLMLFGSSVGYDNENDVANIEGAFAWPSWNLANYDQWSEHRYATAGMRLFDCWGCWKKSTTDINQSHRRRPASATADGHQRRAFAFREHNARVEEHTSERRAALLEKVLRLNDGSINRGLGRERLRQKLAACGLNISDREARWLARQLKSDLSMATQTEE